MRRAALRVLPALAVIAAAVAVVLLLPRGSAGSPAAAPPSAQDWTLPRLEGAGSVSLRQLRGRPLVVDFYASWCTACRDELPELAAVAQRATGVRFIAVDSEENGDGLAMARRSGIGAWTLLRDVGGSQASGLRDAVEVTPGMPVLALYDAGGRLVTARLGAVSGDTLASLLAEHFGVVLSPG
jgi:thiol-disulfide isomerase/thioredoxin